MKLAAVFPGQGSQKPGMGRPLYDSFREAKDVFDEVDEALGEKLSKVIFEGDEKTLTETVNAQPALMAVSTALVRVLEKRFDFSLSARVFEAAGHSLGEITAITACGGFEIASAARLLRLRGKAMAEAAEGGMAALLKLTFAEAEELISEVEGVYLANDNSPLQQAVSGDRAAIEKLLGICARRRIRAVKLPVSAPFHSPYMKPATARLAAALKGSPPVRTSIPIVANVDAEPRQNPELIADNLVRQVEGTVRWRETLLGMASRGVEAQLEIGAGKVLTGLAKRTLPDWKLFSVETAADLEYVIDHV